ncbi:inverse autotransporter beta domain-containing protein [Chlamydiota bacterium]
MMKKIIVSKSIILFGSVGIFYLVSFFSFSLANGTISQEQGSLLPPTEITLGGRFSEDDSNGYIDFLIPVIGNEQAFWFINPRALQGESQVNEQNVGIGYRRLIDNRFIIGGNVFYDTRETTHGNRFDQVGIGLEFLTEWVDLRMNGYFPLDDKKIIKSYFTEETAIQQQIQSAYYPTSDPIFIGHGIGQKWEKRTSIKTTTTVTTRFYEQYEEAMDGADIELGCKVPWIEKLIETRVFGGYYYYNSKFGSDLKGFKARIEVRALPFLIIDGEWYEDEELHGTDYYIGARVHVPFEFGDLFKGKNPMKGLNLFKRKRRAIEDRMTDMIIRDMDVIVEESQDTEITTKKTVEISVNEKILKEKKVEMLVEGINFIEGDPTKKTADPNSDGSFEHPYTRIQDGIDRTPEGGLIIIDGGPYYENIKLKEGQILRGSGPCEDCDDDCILSELLSGEQTVIIGDGTAPIITLASGNSVVGFYLSNPINEAFEQNEIVGYRGSTASTPEIVDVSSAGIFGVNVTDIYIACNIIENTLNGIVVAALDQKNFSIVLKNNSIRNTAVIELNKIGSDSEQIEGYSGVYIRGNHTGETFYADIRNNEFNGIQVEQKRNANQWSAYGYGLYMYLPTKHLGGLDYEGYDTILVDIENVQSQNNYEDGLFLVLHGKGDIFLNASNIDANNNGKRDTKNGLPIIGFGPGVDISLNTKPRWEEKADILANISNITTQGNTHLGFRTQTQNTSDDGMNIINISNVNADNNNNEVNGATGFVVKSWGTGDHFVNIDNVSANNQRMGADIMVKSNRRDASLIISNLTANNNRFYGVKIDEKVDTTLLYDEEIDPAYDADDDNDLVAQKSGNLYLELKNITVTDNGTLGDSYTYNGYGLYIGTRIGGLYIYPPFPAIIPLPDCSIIGEHIVSRNNVRDGVFISHLGPTSPFTGTVTIDFGGGPLSSPGQNTIYGNVQYGVATNYPASFQYTYWNGAPSTNGPVDSSNPLASDPN